MRKKIQLASSGISFVDETWGGFYSYSTYLLVGPRKSGKTLLGLQFAKESVSQQSVCVYFTEIRPKDLIINASAINFDLQQCMDQNQVIVIRTNLPSEQDLNNEPDKFLSGYLLDIISIIEQYQPGKIVVDELTPFVNYNDIKKLKEVYLQTREAIEDMGITSLFILGEPVAQQSKEVFELLKENSTGIINLSKREKRDNSVLGGKIIITPNIGHTEGHFSAEYSIIPQSGIVTNFIRQKESVESKSPKKMQSRYRSLSEMEVPPENYPIINYYNENEFRLLLNNQIAYYKSTGQLFTLCSIFIDEKAAEELLTLNQLKSAVRLSIDKKDKICFFDDRIVVMVIDEEQKNVNNLIARIKSNLPGESKENLARIIQHIYIFTLQVNKNINSTDDFLSGIFSDKIRDNK